MNVCGLDISTKRIGYTAPNGTSVSITSTAGAADPGRRLFELEQGVARTIRDCPPFPELAVIEGYGFAANPQTSARLGEIGGCIRRLLVIYGVRYVEVAPATLKLFATGKGNADKTAMIAAAVSFGARRDVNHDEADAYLLRRFGRVALGLVPATGDHQTAAIANCKVVW